MDRATADAAAAARARNSERVWIIGVSAFAEWSGKPGEDYAPAGTVSVAQALTTSGAAHTSPKHRASVARPPSWDAWVTSAAQSSNVTAWNSCWNASRAVVATQTSVVSPPTTTVR